MSVPLPNFFSDRRFVLLCLTVGLAVLLGFVSIPDRLAIGFVSKFGFWFVLAAFVIWLRALWQTFGTEIAAMKLSRIDWLSVAIVVLAGIVLLVHETFGFKIVMDEIMLLGTSMSMHLDKSVFSPVRGNDIQGAFVIIDGVVDKRPLFFPLLVSLLHDLTGYRPANSFVLNSALTFIFVGLVFAMGRKMAGRIGGWLGVVLLAGLPLLAQNCTGGGFELLNLTMMAATLLLAVRWLEKRDGSSLTALCFSGLLLAQVRYESVIFLLPVAALVLLVWFQERRAILPWPVIFAPLLLVHYPLHQRIFTLRESAWEMVSKPEYSTPFSLSYVPDSLVHALKFFFGAASDQPNSIVLSVLGCLALPFFVLLSVKRLRRLAMESPINLTVTLFGFAFALHFALMMCYVWRFDEVITRRLSLPAHLGMVIAVLAVLPQFKHPAFGRILLGSAVLGLVARSVPSMAAHAYNQEYLPGLETAWRRQFIAAQPRSDYLMIDNDSSLWVSHRVSATPTAVAVKRRTDIAFHMRNRTFSDVYVFQRFNIDAESGEKKLRDGDDLGPAFVLEPVVEQRLQLLTLTRISRVKEIHEGEVSISARAQVLPSGQKSRAEIEKARQLFLESYMKQLP